MIRQADMYCDKLNELTEQIENLSFESQFQLARRLLFMLIYLKQCRWFFFSVNRKFRDLVI